jgi:hypothetical protein
MSSLPSTGTAANETARTQPATGRPAGAPRLVPPRCPRCGAGMGRLAAEGADDALVYCGCCGVVLAAPER